MTVEPGASKLRARTLLEGPPRYVARSPWGPWTAAAATVLVFAGQIIGVALAAALLYAGQHGAGTPDLSNEKVFATSSPVGLAIMIASQLASLTLVWLFAGRQGARSDVLQLNPPRPTWGACLAGGLVVIVVTGVLELILYVLVGFDAKADSAWLAEGLNSRLWLGVVVMAVLLAPLWEELTFRGFLLSALAATRLGFWGGALVSNVVWTALHASYSAAGVASVFTAGMLLSWLLWRTGSIRVPIAAHALANLVAVVFAYLTHAAT